MKIDWSKFDDEVLNGVELCKEISEYGYEAYIVGGCVRDIVLWHKKGEKGSPNVHDVDIATNMPIEELQDNFRCASNNGEAHGTILVIYKDIPFEVTQFRTDGDYSDGRHPDSVKFTKSFKDDTDRRDFTINAMGIDYKGNLIDFHGGEQDLERNILRTVGKAEERFNEDSLRIIRALRFAARFGLDIDDDTLNGIDKIKGKLDKVAKERIGAELIKTAEYGAEAFAKVISLIRNTKINEIIDQNTNIDWDMACKLTKKRISYGTSEFNKNIKVAFGCLLYGSDLKESMNMFRLENDLIKSLNWCYNHFNDYEYFGKPHHLVESVNLLTNKNFDILDELANIILGKCISEEDYNNIYQLSKKVLPHSKDLSNAIIDAGIKGQHFGTALKELSDWFYTEVFKGNIPDNDEIEEYALNL